MLKKITDWKKAFVFSLFLLIAKSSVFAQDIVPAQLTTFFDNLVNVFRGPIVRSILIMCLCGCAIAYGFNKDNEKMKRGIIAIGVAIAILICATTIVDAIGRASGTPAW